MNKERDEDMDRWIVDYIKGESTVGIPMCLDMKVELFLAEQKVFQKGITGTYMLKLQSYTT